LKNNNAIQDSAFQKDQLSLKVFQPYSTELVV